MGIISPTQIFPFLKYILLYHKNPLKAIVVFPKLHPFLDANEVSENDFLNTVSLLKRKKNIILQGPPGVDKTFIARKLAYAIMHEVKDADI